MGLLMKPRARSTFWSADLVYNQVYLNAHMTSNRFDTILKCVTALVPHAERLLAATRFLHASDERGELGVPARQRPDPLFKVRALTEAAVKRWKEAYVAPAVLSGDESVARAFARTENSFNVPSKTDDVGLWLWVLASHMPKEYIHSFRVRMRREKYKKEDNGGAFLGTHVIMKLCLEAGVLDGGRTIVRGPRRACSYLCAP
jgi:hypothetical protein